MEEIKLNLCGPIEKPPIRKKANTIKTKMLTKTTNIC